MQNIPRREVLLITVTAWLLAPTVIVRAQQERVWSVAVYGGQQSDTRIGQILYFRTDMKPTSVWAASVSRQVYAVTEDLTAELEVNVARHTGHQNHFEINGAFLLRWHRFPWDGYVHTSLAYGAGPSYAFRPPPVEQRSRHDPVHALVFMPVELTFGPPGRHNASWELLLRIHHRSGAYGVVSEAGGSNFVTAGIRHRF